eukprot:1190484-Prorocentrum_minimum.AAC.2
MYDEQSTKHCFILGLLHTIMFNRALGPVRPRDVDSELFEISYVPYCTGTTRCQKALKVVPKDAGVCQQLRRCRCDQQVQCGDSGVERKIEEKINNLCNWVEKCQPGKRVTVRAP